MEGVGVVSVSERKSKAAGDEAHSEVLGATMVRVTGWRRMFLICSISLGYLFSLCFFFFFNGPYRKRRDLDRFLLKPIADFERENITENLASFFL